MSTNTRAQRSANNFRQRGSRAAHEAAANPIVGNLLRLGYIVRGLLYGVIGVVALHVALNGNGSLADPQGAIAALGKTPLGGILLYFILVGLIGYALWGVFRALLDPLQEGSNLKGLVVRGGYLVSAVSYGLLALATYGLITGGASAARNGAQTAQTQQNTASILSYSWAPWAVGLVALILIASGVVQLVQGVRGDFKKYFQPYALSSNQRLWIERLGRFGTAARGVVFSLVGVFLFLAAYLHDPRQAQGIDGALASLLHQPYGPWLLGVVAVGLIAFGIYSALSGIWLRIKR